MGTRISPVSAEDPAIPHGTYYYSFTGADFIISDQDGTPGLAFYSIGGRDVLSKSDSNNFICPVHLPNGAVITSCVVYGNAAATAETWELERNNFSAVDNDVLGTANIGTADNSIADATVDNTTFSYRITTSSLDIDDEIWGGRITYTL